MSFKIINSQVEIEILFFNYFFPTRFNYQVNIISDQGNAALDPAGGLIWKIGVVINGIAHFPHIFYIYNKINPINFLWGRISTLFGLIAAVGFIFVGAIPVDYGTSHNICSIFAFVGYFVAVILNFLILHTKKSPIKDKMHKSKIN